MADRILVMREGRLVAELDAPRGHRGDDRGRRDRPGPGGGGLMATVDRAERPAFLDRMKTAKLTDIAYRLRAYGIVAALVLLIIVTALIQPRFLSGQEVNIVLGNWTILALLTLGEAMVIITRNVDLSIGSIVGLAAYVSGTMFGHLHGVSTTTAIVISFLVGIGIGMACGVVNGALTTIGRIPSLVVTLATLYIIRGIAILIIGGGQVVASSLPDAFFEISLKSIANVPYLAIAVAVVIAGRRVLHALVPLRPRHVRDRIAPRRGAARRDPGRQASLHRLRRERRAGRARPACSGRRSTARSTRPRARATSSR